MKQFFKIILTGIFLFFMFACAPAVSRHDASNLTVGILNNFPDTPNYIKQRTFVFRHQVTDYGTDKFKNMVTQSAKDYLLSKGYKVIIVEDKTALKEGRADMIVQIQPMDIFKHDGTLGYGFYDRRILEVLVKQPARSYICLNMNLIRKDHFKIVRTGRQENFSKLIVKELPKSPDQLTEDQRKEMSLNLTNNIRETIFRVLPMLGL